MSVVFGSNKFNVETQNKPLHWAVYSSIKVEIFCVTLHDDNWVLSYMNTKRKQFSQYDKKKRM